MSEDQSEAPERPLLPPEPAAGTSVLGWMVTLVALVVLVVGAWKAYQWLAGDVAHRRALAEGAAAYAPAASAPAVVTAPAPTAATPDAPPPAVTGQAVNRCVQDGVVLFTNQPCPTGSAVDGGPAGSMFAPAVGGSVPVGGARLTADADNASLHDGACHYLAAEVERLAFEFRQPLPPPVLDQISTHLTALRSQSERAGCPALPKADTGTTPTRQQGAAKVLDEKPSGAPATPPRAPARGR